MLDLFLKKFSLAYTPGESICIDKSLLLYKGRIVFKLYIPLKRARYGIMLCCCLTPLAIFISSGYTVVKTILLSSLTIKCHQNAHTLDMTVTEKTIISLMTGFLNKKYHLFI